MRKRNTKNKILIPLFYDYHLFGYLEDFIIFLSQQGYEVYVLTSDPKIIQRYSSHRENIHVLKSFCTRVVIRLMDVPWLRALGWIIGWFWSYFITQEFSVVILPRDTRPYQYLVSLWRPVLVIQPSLGKFEKLYLQHKYGTSSIERPSPHIVSRFPLVDNIFGGRYLTSVSKPMKNKTYAVIGDDFKEFYEKIGAQPSCVVVTGNPNFEGIKKYNKEAPELGELKQAILYKEDEIVLSFFPSQLEFTEAALKRLSQLLIAINQSALFPLLFIIKPHPRTSKEEKDKLTALADILENIRLIVLEGFYGDENNTRLLSLSSAAIVEESNVGVLAAYIETPLFVFEINGENKNNLFRLFDVPLLTEVTAKEVLQDLKAERYSVKSQNIMIEKIAKRLESPYREIVELLKQIIQNP